MGDSLLGRQAISHTEYTQRVFIHMTIETIKHVIIHPSSAESCAASSQSRHDKRTVAVIRKMIQSQEVVHVDDLDRGNIPFHSTVYVIDYGDPRELVPLFVNQGDTIILYGAFYGQGFCVDLAESTARQLGANVLLSFDGVIPVFRR